MCHPLKEETPLYQSVKDVMKNECYLSIVIPAYNEEKTIEVTLKRVLGFLSKENFSWEVIIVDDGSSDKTSDLVSSISNPNVKLVKLKTNKGKGGALRAGIKESVGRYVIFMDADLSVPLENIDKFISEFKKFEVVIASRRVKGAKILIHQPWHREMMGRFFTILTWITTGVKLADYTCGFKGFRLDAAKNIFGKSLIDRWAYDAEIMFLAHKLGYNIKQVPISWENRDDTRVRLKSAVFESFRDLIKIRINNLLGKYDTG
jgi:dolichyl-phosphate beta-glucosyltransferase